MGTLIQSRQVLKVSNTQPEVFLVRESHSNKMIRSNDLMRSHQSISKSRRFSLPCYLIRTTGVGREKVQTCSESCFAFLNSGGKLINCHNNLASWQRLTHLRRELTLALRLVLFRDSLLPPENGPGTQAGKERVLYYLQAHARNDDIFSP